MSDQVSTEVEISVGTLPSVSGFQLSLDVGSGLVHQSAIKTRLQHRIGEEPQYFRLYLSVPCPSNDAAAKLANHLKTTYEGNSNNSDSPIGEVLSKLKPDPDEPALASFEFSHYGSHAFVVVSGPQHEDQAKMFYEMALDQAGPIFNSGNLVHFELDTGRNLGEILSPNSANLITESALIKFVFTADTQALVHARGLAGELGPQGRKTQRILALASLYNGASLKFNFKSGADMPEVAKDQLNAFTSMIPPLGEVLPPPVLEFVNGVLESSGHEVFINVLTENVAVDLHLSAKGASQILQRN
jgi:hypothetical protein